MIKWTFAKQIWSNPERKKLKREFKDIRRLSRRVDPELLQKRIHLMEDDKVHLYVI